ncbi:MAG: chalcone isomerase family protein [Rhodoferax sp.]|jgi:hypothetical protein|nr:chalcone isomerase family protein [Rhodoferax sp.]MBP9061270.1 chalcone isomerase family protein [Rhodoferax sp.]MBP9685328.1 chalcone isomerase family protein [Rhodoferax sp.]
MKLMTKNLTLAALLAVLALNANAVTLDIHGIKLEDSATVAGVPLKLNGAGTRYKGPFKVYVAGLYLGKKTSSPEEVVSQPGPKRLSITMVRNIEARELGRLLTRGIEDNMGKAAVSKLIPGMLRMGEIFAVQKKLGPEDNLTIEWVPGSGTVITVRGQVQGEPFKEPEFFKAMMSIWLGPDPADWRLKEELLGIKKVTTE